MKLGVINRPVRSSELILSRGFEFITLEQNRAEIADPELTFNIQRMAV